MNHWRTHITADGLLAIGFTLSLIGFVVVMSVIADRAAFVGTFPSEQIAARVPSVMPVTPLLEESACPCPVPHSRPGAQAAPVTVSLDPLPTPPTIPSVGRKQRDSQGEAAVYLQETAAL